MRTFLDVLQFFPIAQHWLISGSQYMPTAQQTGAVLGPSLWQRRSPAQQTPPQHCSCAKQSPSVAHERLALTHVRGLFGLGRAQT